MAAVWFERLWKLVPCIQTSLGLNMCRVGFVHVTCKLHPTTGYEGPVEGTGIALLFL